MTRGSILLRALRDLALLADVVDQPKAVDQRPRGECRRETPVTLAIGDGTLLEGVVDLAFLENGTWTVVDYKTDRELAASGEARYRRQVALYASAVSQATGCPVRGVLVRL